LARLGVPVVPWRYIADEEQLRALPMLNDGPIMLRTSRSSGGTGIVKLEDADMLEAAWWIGDEAFVSVAPYIAGGIPVNVGGVAWHDGVTLHPASIQLIGHRSLTNRPFGYCGNDFAAVANLRPAEIAQLERSTLAVGNWLRQRGYVGAFGVDFLVVDGEALFTEVNPRLQGSTHLSCRISVELDESCLLLEHTAALLDMNAPPSRSLQSYVTDASAWSHMVVHNIASQPRYFDALDIVTNLSRLAGLSGVDVLPPPRVAVAPNATVARVTVARSVTTDGFDLASDCASVAADITASPAGAADTMPPRQRITERQLS
jgi:formate-dependent phosphoribosylglycinamide formyltransferase (GAR transformylase)